MKFGHWCLQLPDQALGYRSDFIFKRHAYEAENIHWGGEMINLEPEDHHTQMERCVFGVCVLLVKALQESYFRSLGSWASSNTGKFTDQEKFKQLVSKPLCYDLRIANYNSAGLHFYILWESCIANYTSKNFSKKKKK